MDFYDALEKEMFPLPDITVITHWHYSQWISRGKTREIAVEKGTYYVTSNTWSSKKSVAGRIKYTFKKIKPGGNYSPITARNLQAGNTATMCITPRYAYSRWFKIVLKSKKGISVWCSDSTSDFNVYDVCLNEIAMESAGKDSIRYNSKDVQESGTYFIRVRSDYNLESLNRVIKIKWN